MLDILGIIGQVKRFAYLIQKKPSAATQFTLQFPWQQRAFVEPSQCDVECSKQSLWFGMIDRHSSGFGLCPVCFSKDPKTSKVVVTSTSMFVWGPGVHGDFRDIRGATLVYTLNAGSQAANHLHQSTKPWKQVWKQRGHQWHQMTGQNYRSKYFSRRAVIVIQPRQTQ